MHGFLRLLVFRFGISYGVANVSRLGVVLGNETKEEQGEGIAELTAGDGGGEGAGCDGGDDGSP